MLNLGNFLDEWGQNNYHPVGIQVSDSIIIVKQYDENFQCPDKFKSTTEKKNMTLHILRV